MTFPTGKRTSDRRSARAAFTLIELILIMSIITIAAAIVTPSLSKFFRGRTQEAEAARLLSLAHYGQNRAVSEGVPTLLWVNPNAGTYGLQQETGYNDGDPKAVNFAIDQSLKIDVANGARATIAGAGKLPAIHFLPDGTISQASVSGISVQESDRQPIWVVQAANGLNYEIR